MSGSSFARKKNAGILLLAGCNHPCHPVSGTTGTRQDGSYSYNAGMFGLKRGAGSRVGLPDRQVISLQSRIHLEKFVSSKKPETRM